MYIVANTAFFYFILFFFILQRKYIALMQTINNGQFTREIIWTSKRRITSPKQLFYQPYGYPQIIVMILPHSHFSTRYIKAMSRGGTG